MHASSSRILLPSLVLPLLLVLLSCAALAQQGHLVLLSVATSENLSIPDRGGTADLYLEIRPGSGKIFLDTFPLTKLDTQSSTRYANQVACSYTGKDCSRYDFFYTIRADSTVIGGPSAGGAIAVLTAAMLEGKAVDESIAMTGTINSGGIIGPVAGLQEKATAAEERKLSRVLVSAFSAPTEVNRSYLAEVNGSNANLSLLYVPVNLSELEIPVTEVATLAEALALFTGEPLPAAEAGLETDPSYDRIMRRVSGELCDRREGLLRSLELAGEENLTGENESARMGAAEEGEDWYSLASYCFSSLIRLRGKAFEPLPQPLRKTQYAALLQRISASERELAARNLTTLAQLETSMIVGERLREAKEALREENLSNISAATLGFAYERANSADVWSAFFRMESPAIALDEGHLATACEEKLAEAGERIEYVGLYIPETFLKEAGDELDYATLNEEEGRYAFCLFRASKAQALADLFASSLSVTEEKLDALIARKLEAARSVIAAQERKGAFPILGYSYYQYASDLAEHDRYSALTFAEYSLELSNLDIYFPRRRGLSLPAVSGSELLLFGSGMLLGLALGLLVGLRWRRSSSTVKGSGRKSRKRNK